MSIRIVLSPRCSAVLLQSFPNTPSLGRSSLTMRSLPLLPGPTQNPPSSALPQLKTMAARPAWSQNPRSPTLESMLSRVCDGDHFLWVSWIGWDPSITTGSAPSRCRTITTLTTMPRRWLRQRRSALAVPPYVATATWPIAEMPHGDVADFCLAAPRMSYVSGGFPVSFPAQLGSSRSRPPWSRLICDEKGRYLPTWLR
jgi:hypothetical protein